MGTIPIAVLLIGGLLAQQAPPSLAAFLVRHTVEVTRADLSQETIRGPVFVDMDSLLIAWESATNGVVPEQLLRELGPGYQAGRKSQVAKCESGPPAESSCSVQGDGLLVVVDSLRKTATGYVAVITTHWTDRRPTAEQSAFGIRSDELVVEQVNGSWQIIDSRIRLRS